MVMGNTVRRRGSSIEKESRINDRKATQSHPPDTRVGCDDGRLLYHAGQYACHACRSLRACTVSIKYVFPAIADRLGPLLEREASDYMELSNVLIKAAGEDQRAKSLRRTLCMHAEALSDILGSSIKSLGADMTELLDSGKIALLDPGSFPPAVLKTISDIEHHWDGIQKASKDALDEECDLSTRRINAIFAELSRVRNSDVKFVSELVALIEDSLASAGKSGSGGDANLKADDLSQMGRRLSIMASAGKPDPSVQAWMASFAEALRDLSLAILCSGKCLSWWALTVGIDIARIVMADHTMTCTMLGHHSFRIFQNMTPLMKGEPLTLPAMAVWKDVSNFFKQASVMRRLQVANLFAEDIRLVEKNLSVRNNSDPAVELFHRFRDGQCMSICSLQIALLASSSNNGPFHPLLIDASLLSHAFMSVDKDNSGEVDINELKIVLDLLQNGLPQDVFRALGVALNSGRLDAELSEDLILVLGKSLSNLWSLPFLSEPITPEAMMACAAKIFPLKEAAMVRFLRKNLMKMRPTMMNMEHVDIYHAVTSPEAELHEDDEYMWHTENAERISSGITKGARALTKLLAIQGKEGGEVIERLQLSMRAAEINLQMLLKDCRVNSRAIRDEWIRNKNMLEGTKFMPFQLHKVMDEALVREFGNRKGCSGQAWAKVMAKSVAVLNMEEKQRLACETRLGIDKETWNADQKVMASDVMSVLGSALAALPELAKAPTKTHSERRPSVLMPEEAQADILACSICKIVRGFSNWLRFHPNKTAATIAFQLETEMVELVRVWWYLWQYPHDAASEGVFRQKLEECSALQQAAHKELALLAAPRRVAYASRLPTGWSLMLNLHPIGIHRLRSFVDPVPIALSTRLLGAKFSHHLQDIRDGSIREVFGHSLDDFSWEFVVCEQLVKPTYGAGMKNAKSGVLRAAETSLSAAVHASIGHTLSTLSTMEGAVEDCVASCEKKELPDTQRALSKLREAISRAAQVLSRAEQKMKIAKSWAEGLKELNLEYEAAESNCRRVAQDCQTSYYNQRSESSPEMLALAFDSAEAVRQAAQVSNRLRVLLKSCQERLTHLEEEALNVVADFVGQDLLGFLAEIKSRRFQAAIVEEEVKKGSLSLVAIGHASKRLLWHSHCLSWLFVALADKHMYVRQKNADRCRKIGACVAVFSSVWMNVANAMCVGCCGMHNAPNPRVLQNMYQTVINDWDLVEAGKDLVTFDDRG